MRLRALLASLLVSLVAHAGEDVPVTVWTGAPPVHGVTPCFGTRTTVTEAVGQMYCCSAGVWVTCGGGGGGGGGGNFVEQEVDFGAGGSTIAGPYTVSAAWVTSSTEIVCHVTQLATTDRLEGAEDALIEEITCAPSDRIAATSFKLNCHAPNQGAVGKYKVHCTGG